MKRLTAKVKTLSISYSQIEVTLSGMNYIYFIDPKNVNFFPKDNNGNSVKGTISVGTTIEFDGEINVKTRQLYNVEIK